MIIASGVFGYATNSILVMFEDKEMKESEEKYAVVQKYVKQRELSGKLQARVKNYLEWLND